MERIVAILPYDPHWIELFNRESERVTGVFGKEIVAVHHIGSTSVPGLLAKPIIDLLVEVRDIQAIDHFNAEMVQLGYEPRGEYGLQARRYFPRIINGEHTSHVHVWQSGHPSIEADIAFRDYLISYPDQAAAYGRLKEQLVDRYDGDFEQYIAGKDSFCQETKRVALAWKKRLADQVLETMRLHLIPLSPAQLYFSLHRPDQLEAGLGHPISTEMYNPPVPAAIRIKHQRTTGKPISRALWDTYWLLVIDADDFGAGLLGFKGPPDSMGAIEIGYGIDPTYRRRGYTTEAAGILVEWALQQPGCQAVTAWTDKENAASARVVQKIGMLMARETASQFYWVRSARKSPNGA